MSPERREGRRRMGTAPTQRQRPRSECPLMWQCLDWAYSAEPVQISRTIFHEPSSCYAQMWTSELRVTTFSPSAPLAVTSTKP